jgi:hypothetical protein
VKEGTFTALDPPVTVTVSPLSYLKPDVVPPDPQPEIPLSDFILVIKPVN